MPINEKEKQVPDAQASKHALRSAAMRDRICDAAVQCLDQFGYAETTLSRVQEAAGVSRGALMHHFQGRHEIIAATAERLLDLSLRPIMTRQRERRNLTLRSVLLDSWDRVVNTSGGRAMLEILVACRTDATLQSRLSGSLQDWDAKSREAITEVFRGTGAEPDDAEVLWSICRTFVRGLIVHQQFATSPEYTRRMVARFADVFESHFLPVQDR